MSLDRKRIKPYGDTLNDGAVQLSFTLPVPVGEEAREAARQLAAQMGLEEPQVYHMADLGENYTHFILYGRCTHSIDFTTIQVPKVDAERMNFIDINRFIQEEIGRKVVVIGACTGTDAHTVGIDAIMNMKGYNGEYGLERYPQIDAYNLGSQVPNEEVLAQAMERNADAVLVSQVVTQKGVHIQNLTELVELAEAEGIRDQLILICGGPRITHEIAMELGFDAGFGPGSLAPDVASFIVHELKRRMG
jgi:beta-lysine 5,6-aminomutase beta subunit